MTSSSPAAAPNPDDAPSLRPPWRRVGAFTWRAATGGVDRPKRALTAWLYVRMLALAHFCAFWSIWSQAEGLYGDRGILPVAERMAQVLASAEQQDLGGFALFLEFPTLLLLDPSAEFLQALCGAGVAASLALLLGAAPVPLLALLWLLYLSIFHAGGIFLGYQWDTLLLEATFLALFLAPWRWWSRPSTDPEPSFLATLLLRWLVFRLFFGSGFGKFFLGRQPSMWIDQSALTVFYETQPLPTWIGWWVHQLPESWHRAMVHGVMIEQLIIPLFFFSPRRVRFLAAGASVVMQCVIALAGNYGYFNLLTLGLCLMLWDDHALRWTGAKLAAVGRWLAPRFRRFGGAMAGRARALSRKVIPEGLRLLAVDLAGLFRRDASTGASDAAATEPRVETKSASPARDVAPTSEVDTPASPSSPPPRWREAVRWTLFAIALLFALLYVALGFATTWERWLARLPADSRLRQATVEPDSAIFRLRREIAPFLLVNAYGLFVDMTPQRPEILVEGSHDLLEWRPIEFRFKPGNPCRAPGFCWPHMPRLDWQMWFAALDRWDSPRCAWFLSFAKRLLEGSSAVDSLLAHNPFRHEAPRYVRARLVVYEFTDRATRREDGTWWRVRADSVDPLGRPRLYCPILTLDEKGNLVAVGASGRPADSP